MPVKGIGLLAVTKIIISYSSAGTWAVTLSNPSLVKGGYSRRWLIPNSYLSFPDVQTWKNKETLHIYSGLLLQEKVPIQNFKRVP